MSEGPGWPKRPGDSTRAVHGGERERPASDAITTPLFQTSTYWFKDSEEVRAYQEGRKPRDEYGRYGNPTSRAAEHKLAELEGAEQAVLFASGMCATTTAFFALLPRGGHLVTTSDCYRRTRQFCQEYLSKLDVETTVIEPADPKKLADALRDDTTLFFTESPTNPYLRVIDVAEASRVAHARGVLVVIDSTFASPVNHRALADGADLVLHSATKYLGGHNDLLAGAAAGAACCGGHLGRRERSPLRLPPAARHEDALASHGTSQRERPARGPHARSPPARPARVVPRAREPSRPRHRCAHHAGFWGGRQLRTRQRARRHDAFCRPLPN